MKKPITLLFSFIIIASLVACERPATRSSWAPLDFTPTASVDTTTDELEEATNSPLATIAPTPVTVTTIAMSSLAEKYPLTVKGYELLTWQKDDQWVFTLLTGTNRQKSFDEILEAENDFSSTEIFKVSVIGEEMFKELLTHLPNGEYITWGGMDLAGEVPAGTMYFSYPPDETISELVAYCQSLGITLYSLKEN